VLYSYVNKDRKNLKSVVWHYLIRFHIYALNAFASLLFLKLTIFMCKFPEKFTVTL